MGAQAIRLSNIDIDNALKNKDFEVLFQPIFDLANGALARVETFIRWRHPSLGVLPPGAFISFFETQGRMSELTRYVLAEALREYQSWRGPYPPGFSINLALSDLADEAFAAHLTVVLREAGFPPECVTLECPMPPAPVDLAAASKQFQRLADTGARLAIEVRGRANDFLRSITPFPFAEIKTGGAAILRFARTVRGPGLSAISELLELANAQNAAITAVGVEDQASLSALRGLGFAAAQGNHLGRVGGLSDFTPSRVNDVRELLELEALSKEDLSALFRTGGPSLAPAPKSKVDKQAAANQTAEDDASMTDDLVERLAARIERADVADDAPVPETPADAEAAGDDDPEQQRALKAAAIARARAKLAHRARKAAAARVAREYDDTEDGGENIGETLSPPRTMQNRLSEEFEAFADDERASAEQAARTERHDTPVRDEFEIDEPTAADEAHAPADADDVIAAAPATEQADEIGAEESQADELSAGHEAATDFNDEFEIGDDVADGVVEDADGDAEQWAEHQFAPEMKKAAMTRAVGDAHVSIHGARARFVPGIRVMSAAPAFDDDLEPQTFGKRPSNAAPQSNAGAASAPGASRAHAQDTEEPVAPLFDPAEGVAEAFAGAPAARAPVKSQNGKSQSDKAKSRKPAAGAPTRDKTVSDEPARDETDIGDLHAQEQETVWIEESVAIDNATDTPRRRRKNFLSRKYKMPRYSGHFWPRPIRKWMKQRAAASASRSDDNAAAN
ncbi:MAG: EAL domain-containing protein [Parvularculaceae bacterium]|nr:EAL domain-containing protein [Parvularculaceae bacterium]